MSFSASSAPRLRNDNPRSSNSEIALPVITENGVAAILDIDCTEKDGVNDMDIVELDHIVRFVASRFESNAGH